MRSKIAKGESFIVIGVAAALIAICVAGLGSFLAHAEGAEADTVHDEALPTADLTLTDEVTAPEGLTVIAYTQGLTVPEGAVSAQYATAVASDIAEHTFGTRLAGRVFVTLLDNEKCFADSYGLANYVWMVNAETSDGSINVCVDTATGMDFQADRQIGPVDWTYFDEWNEDVAEQQRLEYEAEVRERPENPSDGDGQVLTPIPEDQLAEIHAMKRAKMMEYVDSMASTPYGSDAVALVNDVDLGNGAAATTGRVMMGDADPGRETMFYVEVSLDDGSYLFVNLFQDGSGIRGYQRSSVDYPTFAYGW